MVIILIALSLSMDAFSLALLYGTYNYDKKDMFYLSIIVGIFHFVMPVIGCLFGSIIFSYVNSSLIVSILFIMIGISMLLESMRNEEIKPISSLIDKISFALAVSIDSLSIGINISKITNYYVLSFSLFSIFSFIFTLIGLMIGKYINKKLGVISTIIGASILIGLGIFYFFG